MRFKKKDGAASDNIISMTDKTVDKTMEKIDTKTKAPLKQLLKEDFFKLTWTILYVIIVLLIVYVIYSVLPIFFSYMYASVGSVVGFDFTSMSTADLIYWLMISLSVGAVVVACVVKILFGLMNIVTNRIFVKHVLKYKK